MNIAAAMDALKVDDLDRTGRHVLLVLACHADRTTASATVSIERLADELGIGYEAARRAVHRALKAGYLELVGPAQNRPGKIRTLRLRYDPRVVSRYDSSEEKIRLLTPKDTPLESSRRIFKEKRRSAPPLAHREAAIVGAVDNGHRPAHPQTCPCAGTGWIAGDDGAVARCPYRSEAFT
jgi:hypothetical protein